MTHPPLTDEMLVAALAVAGLDFDPAERALMLGGLQAQLDAYASVRASALPNDLAPALSFVPLADDLAPALPAESAPPAPPALARPAALDSLAFASISELSALLQTRQVSSLELTEMYLARLSAADPELQCVVTLTADLARAQARRADTELAAGRLRGPLHGLPWGAKDLLATRGIPTTWGAAPYRDQVPAANAAVVDRLEAAGAVLVAKLSVGELAWGDVWFGGTTKTPWNIDQGSSGSSAGSAAATAAGLAAFTLGTETYGSIVSPCTQCRVTGLRPSFGRVSRTGAMALSWSLDKIGPIARSAADCALVFEAIVGPSGDDLTVVDRPFHWAPSADLRGRRLGYLAASCADELHGPLYSAALDVLRDLGATLVPITLPTADITALTFLLWAEAAAAFDELTRSGRDDLLVRQIEQAWPNVFRQARLIPAVEYIAGQRLRRRTMHAMQQLMQVVDAYVAPAFAAHDLWLTNLTGHPAVVVPNGLLPSDAPFSLTFTGRMYDEATALAVADAYQRATDVHRATPPLFTPPLA